MVQRNYFSGWTEKGDSEELGGSPGHISLPHEGEKEGASDSITVGSSATHVKLCIRSYIREKKKNISNLIHAYL